MFEMIYVGLIFFFLEAVRDLGFFPQLMSFKPEIFTTKVMSKS